MIADLPHDVQGHVWEAYREGLHARANMHCQRVAAQIIDHIRVLCNDDRASCEHLLDWMAHMLQHPAVKPRRAVLLLGHEPCGKIMLVNLLSRLVPLLETRDPRADVLGKYNPLMEGALLVVMDEPERLPREQLAHLISDTTLQIRRFRRNARILPSHHRFLLLAAESSRADRRVFTIQCSEECMGGNEKFLTEVFTTNALDTFRDFLLSRAVPEAI